MNKSPKKQKGAIGTQPLVHNFSDFASQSEVVGLRFRYARLRQTRDKEKDGRMMLPIRIEKDEIPFFIAGCAVEALQWKVGGMRDQEWHAERERGDDPSATWRNEIVIPCLQRPFEALEVHEDGRLFGIRRDEQEQIDEGFYDPELLEECLLAKCPRQG